MVGSSVVILHSSSRKDEFWRECALLLASNFEPSQIGRVLDFGSYARGQSPVPAPEVPGHECSEEFFPGLDARPWHEPAQFPWIEGLELQAGVMQEELRNVLADRGRTFSGDSALQSQVMGSGWSAIRLQRLGRWNEETVKLFPKVSLMGRCCPSAPLARQRDSTMSTLNAPFPPHTQRIRHTPRSGTSTFPRLSVA